MSRITRQNPSHLANTLANTNGLLVLYLYHLVNTLPNIDDMVN